MRPQFFRQDASALLQLHCIGAAGNQGFLYEGFRDSFGIEFMPDAVKAEALALQLLRIRLREAGIVQIVQAQAFADRGLYL